MSLRFRSHSFVPVTVCKYSLSSEISIKKGSKPCLSGYHGYKISSAQFGIFKDVVFDKRPLRNVLLCLLRLNRLHERFSISFLLRSKIAPLDEQQIVPKSFINTSSSDSSFESLC